MSAVIAIANSKGGVAKTTTCLSLGGSLAEQGRWVLLVDMDPQAHLTASLGIDMGTLRRTVGDVLLGQSSLVAASRETPVEGLDLVPSNRELVVLDKVLYQRQGYEFRLKEALDRARDQLYDAILLDCPPSFGTLTLNALTAADLLLIPTQCEFYAVRSVRQMLDMVRLVRRKTNPRLAYRLLVVMYDGRNKVHRLVLEYLRRHFREALLETMIQTDTKLRESPAYGLPVTQYAPHTRAAAEYRTLAQELGPFLASLSSLPTPLSGEESLLADRPGASLTAAPPDGRGRKERMGHER